MKDRLLKFISAENLSATQFADEIGVQRSSVSHILSGRNNPSFDFILKILTSYPHLSADWLILGNGSMFRHNESPRKTLFSDAPSSTNSRDVTSQPPEIPEVASAQSSLSPESIVSAPAEGVERIVLFYTDRTCREYRMT